MNYIYLENKEFKKAIKTDKSISVPIRKIANGMPQVVADRQIKFVFSTPDVDRDYDVISQDGIDLTWFQTNPLIFFGHEHSSLPIAKCLKAWIEDGNLVGIIEFAPADNPAVGDKAEGIYQLCKGGFLSAVSIGFMPRSYVDSDDPARFDNDGVDIMECELIEVSIVGIPSNRSALVQEVGTPASTPPLEVPPPEVITETAPEPAKKFRAARLKRILDAIE